MFFLLKCCCQIVFYFSLVSLPRFYVLSIDVIFFSVSVLKTDLLSKGSMISPNSDIVILESDLVFF